MCAVLCHCVDVDTTEELRSDQTASAEELISLLVLGAFRARSSHKKIKKF
jgi:hypothetical protein